MKKKKIESHDPLCCCMTSARGRGGGGAGRGPAQKIKAEGGTPGEGQRQPPAASQSQQLLRSHVTDRGMSGNHRLSTSHVSYHGDAEHGFCSLFLHGNAEKKRVEKIKREM